MLVAFAVVGVPLAVAGWFRPLVVGPTGAAALGMILRIWPAPPRHESTRATQLAAAAALLVIAGVSALNALHPSQSLYVNRDPGVYLTTAMWLSEQGDLRPDGLEGPFATADVPLEAGGPGYYEWTAGADLRPQFFHLFPALLAAGRWVGGDWLMLRVAPGLGALGLFAVWALAARLLRPWFATAAVAMAAVTLPQVWFSRGAFTEPLAQAVIFASLVLYDAARRRPRLGAAAGLCFGVGVMARVDTLVLLAPMAVVLVVDWLAASRAAERGTSLADARLRTGGFLAAAIVPAALGWADVLLVSPTYISDLGPQVAALVALAALTASLGALLVRLRRHLRPAGSWLWRRRSQIGTATAAVVVMVTAAGWVVRPAIQEVVQVRELERGKELVEFLQRAEGQPINGWRTYDEETLIRLAGYVGPVTLAAAIAGGGLLAFWLVTGRARRWLPLVALAGSTTALYLWEMSITADQIWALRRYVPLTFPLVALLAAAAAQWMWREGRIPRPATITRHRALSGAARGGSVAIVVVGVAFPAAVLAPLADAREQEPIIDLVNEVCARLGPDAAVLFLTPTGEARSEPLVQSIQFVCEVPVATADDDISISELDELAAEWAEAGRRLKVVTDNPEAGVFPSAPTPPETLLNVRLEFLEGTLSRRPEKMVEVPVTRWMVDWRPPPAAS